MNFLKKQVLSRVLCEIQLLALASAKNPKIRSDAEYLGPERNSEIFNMKNQRWIYFGDMSVSWVPCSLPSPHQPSENNKTLTMLKSLVET